MQDNSTENTDHAPAGLGSGLVVLASCIVPGGVVVFAAPLVDPDADSSFRTILVAFAVLWFVGLGHVFGRAQTKWLARFARVRQLHPKRRATLRDILALAPVSGILLVSPGGSVVQAMTEFGVMATLVAAVLLAYNEVEIWLAAKRGQK